MFIYLLVIALLICLLVVYDINDKKSGRTQWEWSVIVFFILIAGLRYHIGSDTISYEFNFYYDTPTLSDLFVKRYIFSQFLWRFLMSFCKTVFGSFVALQLVHAIIFNTLMFRFLKKTTKFVFTALFFTFCITWWNLSFEILRESLAVAIYLNALLFLVEKKYKEYIILGLIMIGFHWFAFVMVAITPFMMFAPRKIVIPAVIIVSGYLFLFVDEEFFEWLEMMTSDSITGEASRRLNNYLNQEGGQGQVSWNLNGLIKIFMVYITFPLVTIFYNRSDNRGFNKILVLIILFGILQTKLVIFSRFFNYLNIVLITCFTNLIYAKRIRTSFDGLLYKVLVFIFLVNGLMSFYQLSSHFVPYQTIFEVYDPFY